jgi:hypothetical protein
MALRLDRHNDVLLDLLRGASTTPLPGATLTHQSRPAAAHWSLTSAFDPQWHKHPNGAKAELGTNPGRTLSPRFEAIRTGGPPVI